MKKSFKLLLALLAVLAVMALLLMPGISDAMGKYDKGDNGNYNGQNGDNNGNHYGQIPQNGPISQIQVLTEPLTIILLGSGLVGLAVMRRRIKK